MTEQMTYNFLSILRVWAVMVSYAAFIRSHKAFSVTISLIRFVSSYCSRRKMNLSYSRSCTNLKSIQPSYHEYDYPPCDVYPFSMTPEQAIAENYYDVPRLVTDSINDTNRPFRRSMSLNNGQMWRLQLPESVDGGSDGVSSPTGVLDVTTRQTISAPASPLTGQLQRVALPGESFGVLTPRDQAIYHSLGSSSSKLGKVCSSSLLHFLFLFLSL